MNELRLENFKRAKRVLQYVEKSIDYGLFMHNVKI